MPFENVFIESLAHELAPERVTSAAIEDQLAEAYGRLGIPARCIESLTGIVARRFWDEGTELPACGARVVERALAASGRDVGALKREVGLLVSTSVSKEYLEPSMAAMVHGDVGLPPACRNFDVSNACLGFLTGMELCAELIEARVIRYAVVVAAESSRKVVTSTIARLLAPGSSMQDYKDFLPTLTLGSGAVAALLCHRDAARAGHRFHGVVSRAATEHSRICLGTYDWMRTDAPKLLSAGVEVAAETFNEASRVFDWSDERIDQYICHQVGAAHLAALLRRLSLTQTKAFPTYPELGNMGAAAMPTALNLAAEQGRIRAGDTVALMGIGSGLNVSMAKVTW